MVQPQILAGIARSAPRFIAAADTCFAGFTLEIHDPVPPEGVSQYEIVVDGTLASHAVQSINPGESVIVIGVPSVTPDQTWRVRATHVGHDLRYGRSLFAVDAGIRHLRAVR